MTDDKKYLFQVLYHMAAISREERKFDISEKYAEYLLNSYSGEITSLNKEFKNKFVEILHLFVHLKALKSNNANMRTMQEADAFELEIWGQVFSRYSLGLDKLWSVSDETLKFKNQFLQKRIAFRDGSHSILRECWEWLDQWRKIYQKRLTSSSYSSEIVFQLGYELACDEFVWIYHEAVLWILRKHLLLARTADVLPRFQKYIDFLESQGLASSGDHKKCNYADMLLFYLEYVVICYNGKSYYPTPFYWAAYLLGGEEDKDYQAILAANQKSDCTLFVSPTYIMGELYFRAQNYEKAIVHHIKSVRMLSPYFICDQTGLLYIGQKYDKIFHPNDIRSLTGDVLRAKKKYEKELAGSCNSMGYSSDTPVLHYYKRQRDILNYARTFLLNILEQKDLTAKLKRIEKFGQIFNLLYQKLSDKNLVLLMEPGINPVASGYVYVYLIELKLRRVINNVLENSHQTFEAIISKEQLDACIHRRLDDLRKGVFLGEPEGDLIDYLSFGELVALIEQLWKNRFAKKLGDKDIFFGKLKEIETIRNRIAHFRPINKKTIKRLEHLNDEIDIIQKFL